MKQISQIGTINQGKNDIRTQTERKEKLEFRLWKINKPLKDREESRRTADTMFFVFEMQNANEISKKNNMRDQVFFSGTGKK